MEAVETLGRPLTVAASAGRPGRWILPLLVCMFILLSAVEVGILSMVARAIGVLPTLVLLLVEASLGVWLMRREGRKSWRALVETYSAGRMPSGQLADAALILVGGLMLILPGFVTDLLGLVCLLPWTRPFARRAIGMVIARQSWIVLAPGRESSPYDQGTVIPGETVPDPQPRPDPGADPEVIRGEIEE